MPIFYVYILKCTSPSVQGRVSLYTGSTQNLMHRIDLHKKGRGAKYTRGKIIDLVYYETLLSRSAVMKREYEIKSLTTAKKWQIINDFQQMMESDKE